MLIGRPNDYRRAPLSLVIVMDAQWIVAAVIMSVVRAV
jgi:hypothetical protein